MQTPLALEGRRGTRATLGGRELLVFAGCDYLGLSTDPEVLEALRAGLERYGVSAGASRTTTGATSAHQRLEEGLAEFLGLERALLLPEGWLADAAAFELSSREAHVALLDSGCHASLFAASRAAGLEPVTYEHLDPVSLMRRLDQHPGDAPLVGTDGLFPAEARCAPLADLLRALPPGGRLLVDDAHGLGVLGQAGAGTLEEVGVADPRLVLTGTLSKACGVYGGFVAGARETLEGIERTSVHVGTTPLPPAMAEAACVSLAHLRRPALRERLRTNVRFLRRGLSALGLERPQVLSPVLALGARSQEAGRALHEGLLKEGLLVPLVAYPGGPGAGGWLRIAVGAQHTEEDLGRLIESLLARRELFA